MGLDKALPLSCQNIRYIFSTRSVNESFIEQIKGLATITTIPLVGLSVSEIKTFLSKIDGITDEDIQNISRKYKTPQYLSFLKDKMRVSSNARDCIDIISDDLWAFMDDELSQNQQINEFIDLILVIAYEPNLSGTTALSIITGISEQEIIDVSRNNIYISYNEKANQVWFLSELYREFFVQRFKDKEKYIKEKVLKYYYSTDASDQGNRVPALLIEIGKSEEALQYLTTEKMEEVFSSSLSYSELLGVIEYGIRAAQKTNKASEILKYIVLKNMTQDVCDVSSLQAKVDALFDLGMRSEATDEALRAFAIEDRLLLLSRIARKMKEKGISIDDGIIINIRELHNRIDYSKIKENAIKIASEIIFFEKSTL